MNDPATPLALLENVFYRREYDRASGFSQHNHVLQGPYLWYMNQPVKSSKEFGECRMVLVQGTRRGRLSGIQLHPGSDVSAVSMSSETTLQQQTSLFPSAYIINVSGRTPNGTEAKWQLAMPSEDIQLLWLEALKSARLFREEMVASGEAERLRELAKKMKDGLVVRNRFYRFKLYSKCFDGRKAVTWLMNERGLSQMQAVALGNKMLSLGLFHHVTHEHLFSEKKLLYRFSLDGDIEGVKSGEGDDDFLHGKLPNQKNVGPDGEGELIEEELMPEDERYDEIMEGTFLKHGFIGNSAMSTPAYAELVNLVKRSYREVKALRRRRDGLKGALADLSVAYESLYTTGKKTETDLVNGDLVVMLLQLITLMLLGSFYYHFPAPLVAASTSFLKAASTTKNTLNLGLDGGKESVGEATTTTTHSIGVSEYRDIIQSVINSTIVIVFVITAVYGRGYWSLLQSKKFPSEIRLPPSVRNAMAFGSDGKDEGEEHDNDMDDLDVDGIVERVERISVAEDDDDDDDDDEVDDEHEDDDGSEGHGIPRSFSAEEISSFDVSSWPNAPLMLRRSASMLRSELSLKDRFSLMQPLTIHRDPAISEFPIESDYFVGKCIILVAGLPDSPNAHFRRKQRKFQAIVQGRFKQHVPFNSAYTGQAFEEPIHHMPAKWLVHASLKLLTKLLPAVCVNLSGTHPYLLSPIASTAQHMIVSVPGTEPSIHRDIHFLEDDLSLLGSRFETMSNKARRRFFSKTSNLSRYSFDPQYVYTFDFYQHLLNLAEFHVNLGMIKFDVVKILGAMRPLSLMAVIWSPEKARQQQHVTNPWTYLFNVEIWHSRSLLGEPVVSVGSANKVGGGVGGVGRSRGGSGIGDSIEGVMGGGTKYGREKVSE